MPAKIPTGSGGMGVTLSFGGEARLFKLRIAEWRKVEAKCQAGPEELAARLAPTATALASDLAVITAATMGLTGKWRVDDVREVLIQGLIGGGMDHIQAGQLVHAYFDLAPIRTYVSLAYAIVADSLEPLPVTTPGEVHGEAKRPGRSPANKPTGATSSAAAAGAVSRRKRSSK